MNPVRFILTASIALALVQLPAPALTLPVSEDTTAGLTAKGAATENSLRVASGQKALIRFEAGAFATDMPATDLGRARLVVYVSKVTTPGDLTLHRVTQDWSESATRIPAHEAKPIATIPAASVVAKQFVIIDVTPTVREWLAAPGSDFGFALVSAGGSVLLGAKEGSATGHPAQLQLEAGGDVAEATPGDEADTSGGDTRSVPNNSVTTKKIRDGAVTTPKLAVAAVTTDRLASGAVTAEKLGAGSVGTGALIDGSVANAKLASASVTSDKIASGAITSTTLATGAVTNTALAAGSVTGTALAAGAVTSAAIADGTITNDDISAGFTFPPANVADGSITTAKLADTAVTNAKLNDNAVTTAKINDTAVTNAKLNDNAVTTAKINDTAVTTAKISDTAVTTAKINNGAVTSAKLAANLSLTGNTTTAGRFFATNTSTAFAQSTTGLLASALGVQFDGGVTGVILEDGSASESGGFFANGNTAAIWSPGDTGAIVSFYDEDNFASPSPGTPLSFVDTNGAYVAGSGITQSIYGPNGPVVGNFTSGNQTIRLNTAGSNQFTASLEFRHNNDTNGFSIVSDERSATNGLHFIDRNLSGPNPATIMFMQNDTANVGVGTTAPSTRLHVAAPGVTTTGISSPAHHVMLIQDTDVTFTSGLAIQSAFPGVHSAAANNFITFYNSAGASLGSIEGNGSGSVQLGGAGSDYAEYLLKADPGAQIAAAEIVGVRDGRIVPRGEAADQYMVVTAQAIVAGNRPSEDEADLAKRSLVSFIGQVPVQVLGPVQSGDYILASEANDGTGIALPAADIAPSAMPRIVGRAWEASSEAGLKTVNVAVGLDQTGLVAPALDRLEQANRELRAENAALAAKVAALEARDRARDARLAKIEAALEDNAPARTVRAAFVK